MCCHVRSASGCRRRRGQGSRILAQSLPLAVLDLTKPGERQAYDFLCRATSKRDQMWKLLNLRRHGDVLLCVVRWVHPDDQDKPYALAEVGLRERAVCWRSFSNAKSARSELERRSI